MVGEGEGGGRGKVLAAWCPSVPLGLLSILPLVSSLVRSEQ